jgi:hypothetical protein
MSDGIEAYLQGNKKENQECIALGATMDTGGGSVMVPVCGRKSLTAKADYQIT